MVHCITRFSPHQTALTVSIVMALSTLIFIVPMMLLVSSVPTDEFGNDVGLGFSGFFLVLLPLFYFILTYIFTALFAWLYNVVASKTGGIEMELSDA